MAETVYLNDRAFHATGFQHEIAEKAGKQLLKVSFHFQVTSEDYHTVTTLLYQNHFHVKVPEKQLDFQATIFNYATSVVNLYEKGAAGDFYLELIEQ